MGVLPALRLGLGGTGGGGGFSLAEYCNGESWSPAVKECCLVGLGGGPGLF